MFKVSEEAFKVSEEALKVSEEALKVSAEEFKVTVRPVTLHAKRSGPLARMCSPLWRPDQRHCLLWGRSTHGVRQPAELDPSGCSFPEPARGWGNLRQKVKRGK